MQQLTRSGTICLAQRIEEAGTGDHSGEREQSGDHECEDPAAGWLQADPFQSQPMRRLSVGTTRMGKTVGAQAAASRVRGAYPNARVVIFTPIPGSYDRVDDLLATNTGSRGESPRVERIRSTDFFVDGESFGELPAVSIVTPHETGDCTTLAQGFNRFADHLRGDETDETDESGPPVYLIVDSADQLLLASENTDFRDLMRATQDDSIAIHVLVQRADVEQMRPFPEHYTAIDLYRTAEAKNRGWQRKSGVPKDEAVFLNHQATGPRRLSAAEESERPESAWTLARRAAPTGLCYTEEEGWNQVRYTLFNAELEALVASSSSSPEETPPVEEDDGVKPSWT